MGAELKVIIEDTGAGTADTTEMPLPEKRERWKLPAKSESTTSSPDKPGGKKSADPELVDALKGIGKFAAGQVGMGHVVSALDNLTKQLVNVYQAALRTGGGGGSSGGGSVGKGDSGSVRVPDAPKTETKVRDRGTIYENMPLPTKRGEPLPPPVVTAPGGAATAGGTAGGTEAVTAAAGQATQALAKTAAALASNPIGAALIAAAATATAFAVAVGAAAYTVVKAVNLLHNEGERIQDYSASLAREFAQSDVRAMMADMRRAQRIGPDVAAVENLRSRAMEKIADINTELYALLAKFIAKMEPTLEEVIAIMGIGAESVPHIVDLLTSMYQLLTMTPENIAKALFIDEAEAANQKRMAVAIVEYINGKRDKEDGGMDPLLTAFIGMTSFDGGEKKDRRPRPWREPKLNAPGLSDADVAAGFGG